jgi:hypothetical protein
MCGVPKTESRKISSCNSVECKCIWKLKLKCYKDSIRTILAGCTIKSAYNALENLLDIFHLIRKMLGTTVKTEIQNVTII